MTPRLRNLLIGLGISVVIMIVDQVNQSSGSGNSKKPQKAKTQRAKKVIAENSVQKASTPITASVASAQGSLYASYLGQESTQGQTAGFSLWSARVSPRGDDFRGNGS